MKGQAVSKKVAAPHGGATFRDRLSWRAWLAAEHGTGAGIWLVCRKKASSSHLVSYDEALEEALAYGWIDGGMRRLGPDRFTVWFAPRQPLSIWSRGNKARVAQLEAQGRMQPAGLAAVARARSDGSWQALDAVEALELPPDLQAALHAQPSAEQYFANLKRSARMQLLWWVVSARRATTREQRIGEIVRAAALHSLPLALMSGQATRAG